LQNESRHIFHLLLFLQPFLYGNFYDSNQIHLQRPKIVSFATERKTVNFPPNADWSVLPCLESIRNKTKSRCIAPPSTRLPYLLFFLFFSSLVCLVRKPAASFWSPHSLVTPITSSRATVVITSRSINPCTFTLTNHNPK